LNGLLNQAVFLVALLAVMPANSSGPKFVDKTVPEAARMCAKEAVCLVKKWIAEDQKFQYLDTAGIQLGKPFPLYISDKESRSRYRKGQPIDSLLLWPDSNYCYVFPFMYSDISIGWTDICLESGTWKKGNFHYGLDSDILGQLRNAWPAEDGFTPVLVLLYPSRAYDFYFFIPQVDRENLTRMRIPNSARTQEDRLWKQEFAAEFRGGKKPKRQGSDPLNYRKVTSLSKTLDAVGRGKKK
jgi:hypothetical protein